MKLLPGLRKSWLYLLFMSFLPFIIIHPQVNKLDKNDLEETMRNPFKADRSVFISNWLVLGSIPTTSLNDLDKDYFADKNGEENLHPIEGQSVTISGDTLKWAEVKGNDVIDLQTFFHGGKTADAVAYVYAKISRKEAGKVYFYLGGDNGIKVWLNGKLVHRASRIRLLKMDEEEFEGNMISGENHLLLKIQQSKGGWSYAIRMMETPNQLNTFTGNINFALTDINSGEKTIKIVSAGNLDQSLMKQTVKMEVYTTGGKMVTKKAFECSQPVVLNYNDWEDGPYELRFIYNDVRGTKFTKYLTWYKGDILAEAGKIVKSAPDKSIRNPEASLHRMLADMILDKLGNNLQNPDSTKFMSLCSPIIEFNEARANQQIRPGGFIRLTYIDEIDNSPQFCLCFLPMNYDPSKKWPMVVFLHGAIPIMEYCKIPYMDSRHLGPSDIQNVIYIEPMGRGNNSYLGIGDRDVLKCIELAKQKLNVDEDRVYLTGSSLGGYGTWNVATRHPGLFAAIAPMLGGGDFHVNVPKDKLGKLSNWQTYLLDKGSTTAQMESLLNIPVLVCHGDQDHVVDVNLSRYIIRMLQRWNYDVRYIEVPGKDHTDLGLQEQITSWFLQHKRNSSPKIVRIRAADLKTASAYWVRINRRINPAEFIVADAEVLEDNIIRVDTKNAAEVLLSLPAELVDYDKPVKVVWNGEVTIQENSLSGNILLKSKDVKYGLLNKSPKIAGPISDYKNTPYMIVAGTISKDSTMRKLILQKANMMIDEWKYAQIYEPRMKNDYEVTESDMKNYTLYLLGGVNENKVTTALSDKLPFKINPDNIIINGKSIKAKNAILNAIYPNPFNNERYIVLAAANSSTGFYFFDPYNNGNENDFYISDGKIPNYSADAKNEKILVASGFFDSNWEMNETFLSEGSKELRSRCADQVVNNDLSTKVISIEEPSEELLKSYTGIYQMENGLQIKAFIDSSKFKISVIPRNNSFELAAISKNEFYCGNINLSVAFKKEETANDYSMIIYEMGNDYSLKKIK